jgi:alanyl aminopeptidase
LPRVRLPADVRPTHYALSLEVVPERESFLGQTRIKIHLDRPRETILLHAAGLKIGSLLMQDSGGRRIEAGWREGEDEGMIELRPAEPLGPGLTLLRIGYEAPFNLQLEGLYRVEVRGRAYAFTQFQSISARLAFPCFDEPGFKAPFDVELTVRSEHVAVANTLAVAETPLADGLKRVRFATTVSLPTYVLAWAVGPLDVVEAFPVRPQASRRQPLPLRGIATNGRGPELRYALEHAPAQILALEEYLGIGYPFDKLDLIAVPDFAAGAMENPGAITFRESLLLFEAANAPQEQKRSFADVLAHELAHMWFGDLVTMHWWDDTWLNEAFASWMGNRVLQALYPEYQPGVWMLEAVHGAMSLDSLRSARQIRQPVESAHDIENAFDPITYDKGMALLAMFERWLGVETFRRGVRLYLERHRFGTATAEDWLAALSEAAGRDVGTPFQSFLLQPGVPLVEARLGREVGRSIVELRQSRFLPVGSRAARDRTWQIPLCARYGAGSESYETCTLFGGPEGELALEPGIAPSWVLPNADGAAYLRWSLAAEDLRSLREWGWQSLTPRERLSAADSLVVAFEAATLPADEIYAALRTLAEDETRAVAVVPMRLLRFARECLAGADLRPAVEAYARDLYRPVFGALAWQAAPNEGPEHKLLRQDVLEFLALVGRDPQVRAEAERRGRAVLGLDTNGALNLGAVEADLLETCLTVGVQEGGPAAFEAARKHFADCDSALLRWQLLRALSAATMPELSARARELVLDPSLRVNETLVPLERQRDEPAAREAAWRWLQEHFDAVVQRIGRLRAGLTPALAGRFSDLTHAKEVEDFFRPRIDQLVGGPRNLALVLERIELAAARIAAHEAAARRFFRRWLP